jgi:phosphate transport system permease protein
LCGYSDGSVRPITLDISVEFIKTTDLDASISEKMESGFALHEGAIYKSMPSGLVRKQVVSEVKFHPPIPVSTEAITCVDWKTPQVASSFDESQTWTWGASDGASISFGTIDNKVNSFNGSITQESRIWKGEGRSVAGTSKILALMIGSRDGQIESLDSKGRIVVWSQADDEVLTSGLSHTSLAGTESKALVGSPLLGRTTLMIGSQSGHLESVSMTSTSAGSELLSIHRFGGQYGAVQSIDSSPEGRLVAAKFDSGKGAIYYVPTNRQLLAWDASPKSEASDKGGIFFSANAACVGHVSDKNVQVWRLSIPFPEASIASFFNRIWYEGYEKPQHVWQSSTGNVEGEYKFGFMPLIFGTLKATFYSMLIGAPIALMAAIFGSEFMNSRWRARVKPFIELMASVPSVVLGFIGALVLAPILRDNLMMVLLSVVMILFLFVLAAHLWLVIPSTTAIRLRRFRLPILFVLIPLGVASANYLADPVESLLFDGDVIQWLSQRDGTGWAGWFCLAILPVSILVAWIVSGPISPAIQVYARSMNSFRFSIVNLGIFGLATLSVLFISGMAAWLIASTGWDPRGSVLGAYQERNALLVGAILGFAIIPLIYTISEDALQSVPQHLRSASLGCGATTWQTTIRVVVPTAMSGLFSALMIGFGRAVGETMVVLMAAGNTPVMDINPMNGYRTLSATLATELPEAARGSTHFHALFLAAFLLFCFTMVANTIAEMVRMRFRKRAFQL